MSERGTKHQKKGSTGKATGDFPKRILAFGLAGLLVATVVPVAPTQADHQAAEICQGVLPKWICGLLSDEEEEGYLETKITASDGEYGDEFGRKIAFDGETAIITDYNDKVYVYRHKDTNWTEEAILTLPDDEYVGGMDVSSDTLVIGSPKVQAAYVYTCSGSTWNLQAELVPDNGPAHAFGHTISLEGNTSLIAGGGSAYVFELSGSDWSQKSILAPSDGEKSFQVAFDGKNAVLGAASATVDGNESQGAAYIFTHDGTSWTETAKLTAHDGGPKDNFGSQVAIDNDTALIGAGRAPDEEGWRSGAVYIFKQNGTRWAEEIKFTRPHDQDHDMFGISLDLDDNTALVGSPYGRRTGVAYLYTLEENEWVQEEIRGSDSSWDDLFGISVAIQDDIFLVGAMWAETDEEFAGAVYAYQDPEAAT